MRAAYEPYLISECHKHLSRLVLACVVFLRADRFVGEAPFVEIKPLIEMRSELAFERATRPELVDRAVFPDSKEPRAAPKR